MHVSYRMYTLHITLCITAGGNAFAPTSKKTSHQVLRTVLADFISLIDVFSDVFRRGTVSYHRKTSPWNHYKLVCLTFWIIFFQISRIMDFRILINSDYYLLWLFLCSDMLLCLLLGTFYVLYIMYFHICNYIILYLWHVSH